MRGAIWAGGLALIHLAAGAYANHTPPTTDRPCTTELANRVRQPGPTFNWSLAIEGQGARLTPLADTVLLRELDERLDVTVGLAASLEDPREPGKLWQSLTSLLRTWTFTMAAARTMQSTAGALRDDSALRLAASDCRGLGPLAQDGELASQPTFSRLLASLTSDQNIGALEDGIFDSARLAVLAMRGAKKLEAMTLDIDSYPQHSFEAQPGSE